MTEQGRDRGGKSGANEQAFWPVLDDDDLPDEPPARQSGAETVRWPVEEIPPTQTVAPPQPPAKRPPPPTDTVSLFEPAAPPPAPGSAAPRPTGEAPPTETVALFRPAAEPPRPPGEAPPPAETVALPRPEVRPAPVQWPPPEPPRAAPQRIGPPPPPPPVEPPPQRRGRRTALIVIIALLLVAGAGTGVVFAVPGLSAKLGLTSADAEVVIQPPAPPVQFAPVLRAPGGQAPAPTPDGVRAALAGPTGVANLGTLTGSVLDPVTGDVLWQKDAATPLVPASTGKLLVAAAALLSLSHTEQLTTTVVAGSEPGSVVIIGGGDVTLSSLKVGTESVYPGAAHLSDLVAQVKQSGGAVKTVYVDLSRYAGTALEPSWEPGDVAGGHISPIVPAMLDGGRADATAAVSTRSANPAKELANEFAKRIGASVPAKAETTAPQGAKVLGEVRSAPMVELVDTVLQRSDNVLSEALSREVARAVGEEPSFAGGSRATLKVLRDNGFDVTGASLADASGLSGQDKVPASLLATILAVAASPDGKDPRTAKLRPLLGGLPVAGGSGTLGNRYNTPDSSAGKGWVRAKTGTLQTPPVNSLAGVVLDADGRLLVFALMSNGSATAAGRPALDAIAATLRECGCR